MNRWAARSSVLVGIFLGGLGAASFAQSPVTYKLLCQSVGTAPQEPLGDREGHTLFAPNYSCRVEGGPLDGGLVTGISIYEWDKLNGTGLSGNGVIRKPGATAVYELTEFKNTRTMTNGKVTGFEGIGRGTYKLATGSASSLAGKAFSFTAGPNGPGQFVVDIRVE
ncbi:MAG: hypothetical protein ABI580_03270 [Burkholderiaceae bacterium]